VAYTGRLWVVHTGWSRMDQVVEERMGDVEKQLVALKRRENQS
jgi:hypothetical protein